MAALLSFSDFTKASLLQCDHEIVVTGVGGWLGAATLDMLAAALGDQFQRKVHGYASTAREITVAGRYPFQVHELEELKRTRFRRAYVFHYAYLGKEKVQELGVQPFVAINERISSTVESFCNDLQSGGIFFASSGAARYAMGSTVDPDREPYGACKLRDEARFLALARPQFNVSVSRIYNMGGAFINKVHDYALSSMILDVLRGGPVTIRANRPVFRSFVHVRDVVEVTTRSLLEGYAPNTPFDTAANEAVEIGELALRICNVLGVPDMRIDRPAIISDDADLYVGDGAQFLALMRRFAHEPASLEEQIAGSARFLAAQVLPYATNKV